MTTRIAALKTVAAFAKYLTAHQIDLRLDDRLTVGTDSPLRQPATVAGRTLGNRWCVHPMEGWDGTQDGNCTEPMLRRWRRFGASGAKLIWGGEAMAVTAEGRANPNQLILCRQNLNSFLALRQATLDEHRRRYEQTDDVLLGFQLTHSGRFSRPDGRLVPQVAYRHPVLDRKFQVDSERCVISDDKVRRLIDRYIKAAKLSAQVGADFVDIKHCHGYLLHEFLSAHTRPGPFGGSFENRTRILREVTSGIRAEVPGLLIGVRLSAFDILPYRPDPDRSAPGKPGLGVPESFTGDRYDYGFGVKPDDPTQPDLTAAIEFLELLDELDIRLVNISCGSPYYNPHIQRPALFPPSDGYQPPEDPLVGVARQIQAVAHLKARFPQLFLVGSGYSYLQEYLPHVAQYYLRTGQVDSVGLGRAVLSYPEMLADATTTGQLDRRRICRTLSDCTTAPRNGLPSGCYPLDEYYKQTDDAKRLKACKQAV